MTTEGSRRRWGAAAALSCLLAAAGAALGFVHDGKSHAIEAALPKLEGGTDPYVLREAWWDGELNPGEHKIIQHQLFKRNDYWFWVGSSLPESKVSIHIYNSEGKLTEAEAWQDRHVAAARVIPKESGTYYIRVAVDEAEEFPVEWAVIYAFR